MGRGVNWSKVAALSSGGSMTKDGFICGRCGRHIPPGEPTVCKKCQKVICEQCVAEYLEENGVMVFCLNCRR